MSQNSIRSRSISTAKTESNASSIVDNSRDQDASRSLPDDRLESSIFLLSPSFSKRELLLLIIPATLVALVAAAIPPLMTTVIGDLYRVFATYQAIPVPSPSDTSRLMGGVIKATVKLCIMSGVALLLSGLMGSLWSWLGEKNLMYLRKCVYNILLSREMAWFETKSSQSKPDEPSIGAGSLVTIFSSCTEDIRAATGMNMGLCIQHSVTIIIAVIMAFRCAPSLAAVTLSTVPVVIVLFHIGEMVSIPLQKLERARSSKVSNIIECAIKAIVTIKCFNAQTLETSRAVFALDSALSASKRLSSWWAGILGFSQFLNLSIFVQGFWFGTMQVTAGKLTAAEVLAVFWACLIATTTLPHLSKCISVHMRARVSMDDLVKLVNRTSTSPDLNTTGNSSPQSSVQEKHTGLNGASTSSRPVLQTIALPSSFSGAFKFTNVTFHYPSRPDIPVLSNVSLSIIPGEMTFIVGRSGSGKSTVAHLLLRLYEPQQGSIEMGNMSYRHLDEHWARSHIGIVSQHCILFDGSIHDNIALGVAGGSHGRRPEEVTRDEVIATCKLAAIHEFIDGLADGYDTLLGNEGTALSGGQKQRLCIARAYVRDPEVLILDEATSALDATSRLLVFAQIRRWRQNKTTIVITHYLSQINPDDYVHVLRDGILVEHGRRIDLESQMDGGFHQTLRVQNSRAEITSSNDKSTDRNPSASVPVSNSVSSEQNGDHLHEKATKEKVEDETTASQEPMPRNTSFYPLLSTYWPTLPSKPLYILGLVTSILSGVCIPAFGFVLSRLVTLTTSHNDSHTVSSANEYGLYVLSLAILHGILFGVKELTIAWTTKTWKRDVRARAFEGIMKQDMAWFDLPCNSAFRLLQVITQDVDDGCLLFALVIPQCTTAVTMVSTGLIWAMVVGWQLTLLGITLALAYLGLSAFHNRLSAGIVKAKKEAREEVSKDYYDMVLNIRAIRSMSLESIFRAKFLQSVENAKSAGTNSAFFEGLGCAIVNTLTFLTQGLFYYVGARFMTMGFYTFEHMVEVLNLVAFSLIIAAQMMQFTSRFSESLQALRSFKPLLELKHSDSHESQGSDHWHIQGPIQFHNVSFAYPLRPNVQVVNQLSFTINPTECVAIVGASGSGKSTIAALLERLYEPTSGFISINGRSIQYADLAWLRNQMTIVTQQPHLFDAPIHENIGYDGSHVYPRKEVKWAAKEANIHEFVMSLPDGYDTIVGENAGAISGGQAQRIAFSRAILRKTGILILDECTSALDAHNQRKVMEALRKANDARTTIMITHDLSTIRMADRIIVLKDGYVAEEGTYEQLVEKQGAFYKLISVGDWQAPE